jgi:nucleotide-binding universal stress UspA family protein
MMGPEEAAVRHKIREQEMAAAQKSIIDPVLDRITAAGVSAEVTIHHGHATSTLVSIAKDKNVEHIFVGRHGQSRLGALLFGSTANGLVQTSPVPVTVVP